MLEVIISVSILSLVILSLFNVKDNTSLFISKISNKNIESSLFSAFLSFSDKSENKSNNFLDLFEIEDQELKKRFKSFSIEKKENILTKDHSTSNSSLNFSIKEVEIGNGDSKKVFYTFHLN